MGVPRKDEASGLGGASGDAAADEALTPEYFLGVGRWYDDFSQTGDEEVHALLARARES